MVEQEINVVTKHGLMPIFVVHPEHGGPFAPIILYMDAPGIREELRNLARRIARAGYVCILPDMYYRVGTMRFDLARRNDGMSGVIRASMNSLSNAMVVDDTAGILAYLDAQESVKPGPVSCVGYCMSGQYITTVSARFPHRFVSAVSLYGVGIVTDKEDSPHLLVDQIKGELYYSFAETDGSVPDHVIPALRAALKKAKTKHTLDIQPGTTHGFQFPARADYNAVESEKVWTKMFALWKRTLD